MYTVPHVWMCTSKLQLRQIFLLLVGEEKDQEEIQTKEKLRQITQLVIAIQTLQVLSFSYTLYTQSHHIMRSSYLSVYSPLLTKCYGTIKKNEIL